MPMPIAKRNRSANPIGKKSKDQDSVPPITSMTANKAMNESRLSMSNAKAMLKGKINFGI